MNSFDSMAKRNNRFRVFFLIASLLKSHKDAPIISSELSTSIRPSQRSNTRINRIFCMHFCFGQHSIPVEFTQYRLIDQFFLLSLNPKTSPDCSFRHRSSFIDYGLLFPWRVKRTKRVVSRCRTQKI